MQLPAGISGKFFLDAEKLVISAVTLDKACSDNGAGVNHWIQRPPAYRFQADGIECLAGWFDIDPGSNQLFALILQGNAIGEGLGD